MGWDPTAPLCGDGEGGLRADSTNEYIVGREDVAPQDGIAPSGLCSALVLIGAYERSSGRPVLGVINEPFHRRHPQTRGYVGGGGGEGGSHLAVATVGTSRGVPLRCPRPGRAAVAIGVSPPRRWQGRYHWGIAYQGTHLSSLSPPAPPRPPPRVVLSRAEAQGVRDALASLCGGHLRFAAGAGYKMLCVILGHADAYVLSGGSTFAWDACAPHAILCALGGGVVALGDALRARREGDTGTPPQLTYNRPAEGAVGAERWANRGGLVAYVHPQHLEAVLEVLAAVPGL